MKATRNSLSSACIVMVLCMLSPARADFTFGEPVNLGPTVNGSADDISPCMSYDGLELYFSSNRGGGSGGFDLWVSTRATARDDWGPPRNLGFPVNSPSADLSPSISSDGLELYFHANYRSGGRGAGDIWVTRRAAKDQPWSVPENLGSPINTGGWDYNPSISADGLALYFAPDSILSVARRTTKDDPWQDPMPLNDLVNNWECQDTPWISSDDLVLVYTDNVGCTSRPGGLGGTDIWLTRRPSGDADWGPPVNVGFPVNTEYHEDFSMICADGSALYFASNRPGGLEGRDLWQAPILPVMDFNGDGRVDAADMAILTENWGRSESLCDIGPFAWGDGVVDEKDLSVLMEQLMTPDPQASDVSCDTVLSWVGPGFADSYDVYLGTSFDDVSNATRDDPCGVLVSEGHAETTFDPEGLLEFGRTYYWRIDSIDVVIGSLEPMIYRGPVLKFTTEPFARPIENITAAASSRERGMGPEDTVNGSGLDKNDGHSTDGSTMWLSTNAKPHWIQFEFDKVYALHELWVWNSNQVIEPILGFGAKTVKIEYSVDGATWTTLEAVPEFARAPGEPAYKPNTTVSFDGVSAKYVKLSIETNWGGLAQTGLAEVRFFSIPVHASQPAPATGRKGIGADTILTWRAGRQAAQHRVYLGTEEQAVTSGEALVATVSDARFDPGPLNLGTVYYWRIDEVNEAVTPSVRLGEVWSFSTKEYFVAEDFEGYTDEEGSRIYQHWIDGETNKTGSCVGYTQSPFAERTVVHGGNQSMPLDYNNMQSPFYSQADRTFSPGQDWTRNGADTLILCFRGNPIDFLEHADGSIQMSGGGADIWFASDQFRFAYKRLSGDGLIVARVNSLIDTSVWAKAGVMIRDSLDPASAYAFMFPTVGGKRAFQNRTTTDTDARSANSDFGAITLPLWVKVERKGANFTGYYSQDGQNWIKQPDTENTDFDRSPNPVRIPMTNDVYIGLAVTSNNVAMPTIAEFSDVSFTGSVTGDWQVEAIGVEQPSNDPAPLYVAIEDDAGKVKTITHPDSKAVQTIEWRQWLIPFREFTSAGVSLSRVKRMSIGVGDPGNPTPGGAGVIYIDDIGVGHPLSTE